MIIPKQVVNWCNRHRLCKGCPLGTCVFPVSDRDLNVFLEKRIAVIEAMIEQQD